MKLKLSNKNIYEKLRAVIYVNLLTIQISFFSVLAIFGMSYGGSGESNLYRFVLLISSALAYLIIFVDIFLLKRNSRKTIYLLSLPFLVLITFVISGIFSEFTIQTISIFLLLVVPSMLIGYVLGTCNEIIILRNGFVFVSVLVWIGILKSLNALIAADHNALFTIFGGGQYQALSYFCSFSYSMLLANFLFFQIKRTKLITFLYLSMLLVLMLGVVLSGGRGGAVVVVASTLVFSIHKYGFRSTFLKLLILVLFIIILITQIQGYDIYDRIIGGGSRLFSYISDSGLDLSQTSNRDLVWEHTLTHIKESWLFGYGPFTYESTLGPGFYPHNLFLDFFIHGGLIYVLIWIVILLGFFIKLRSIMKRDLSVMIFLVLFFNSFIMLMFSATYLQEGLFWFSIIYIFSYKFKATSKII
jgi:hypothetical protein